MARRHVDDIFEACNRVAMMMKRLRGELSQGWKSYWAPKETIYTTIQPPISADFAGSIFMRQICSSSHEQCLRHAKKKTVRISLLLCSSLLLGWDGGSRLSHATEEGGTESGALRCLRVQVVKRKQISATDGTRAGEGGYRSPDLLLPMDYRCYCLLSLFADWSCLSSMQYLV